MNTSSWCAAVVFLLVLIGFPCGEARQRWHRETFVPRDAADTTQNVSLVFLQDQLWQFGGQRSDSGAFSDQALVFKDSEWHRVTEASLPVPGAGNNMIHPAAINNVEPFLVYAPFASMASRAPYSVSTKSTLAASMLSPHVGKVHLDAGSGVNIPNRIEWKQLPPIPILWPSSSSGPEQGKEYAVRHATVAVDSMKSGLNGQGPENTTIFVVGGMIVELQIEANGSIEEVPVVPVALDRVLQLVISGNDTATAGGSHAPQQRLLRWSDWSTISITAEITAAVLAPEKLTGLCGYSMIVYHRSPIPQPSPFQGVPGVGSHPNDIGVSLFLAGGQCCGVGCSGAEVIGGWSAISLRLLSTGTHGNDVDMALASVAFPRFFYVSQNPPQVAPGSDFPQQGSGDVFELPALANTTMPFQRLSNYMASVSPYFQRPELANDTSVFSSPPFILVLEVPAAERVGMCSVWPPSHLGPHYGPAVVRRQCTVQVEVLGTKPEYVEGQGDPKHDIRDFGLTVRGTELVVAGGRSLDSGYENAVASVHVFDTPIMLLFKPDKFLQSASSTFYLNEDKMIIVLQYCNEATVVKLSSNSLCSDNLLIPSNIGSDDGSGSTDNTNITTWYLGSTPALKCGGRQTLLNTSGTVQRSTAAAYVCYSRGSCNAPMVATGAGSFNGTAPFTPTRCAAGYTHDGDFNFPNCMWAACCASPVELGAAIDYPQLGLAATTTQRYPLDRLKPLCYNTVPRDRGSAGYNWYPAASMPFVVEVRPPAADDEGSSIPEYVLGGISAALGFTMLIGHYRLVTTRFRKRYDSKVLEGSGYSRARSPVLLLLSEDRELRSEGFNAKEFADFIATHPVGQRYTVKKYLASGGSGTLFIAEVAPEVHEQLAEALKRRTPPVASVHAVTNTRANQRFLTTIELESLPDDDSMSLHVSPSDLNVNSSVAGRPPALAPLPGSQSTRRYVLKATMSLSPKEWMEAQHELLITLMMAHLFSHRTAVTQQQLHRQQRLSTRSQPSGMVEVCDVFFSYATGAALQDESDIDEDDRRHCEYPKYSCLVTPFTTHGDLASWVRSDFDPPGQGEKEVPLSVIIQIAAQVGRLLQAMHELDTTDLVTLPAHPEYFLVHRDMKPENILVTDVRRKMPARSEGDDDRGVGAISSISVVVNDFATTLAYDVKTLEPMMWTASERSVKPKSTTKSPPAAGTQYDAEAHGPLSQILTSTDDGEEQSSAREHHHGLVEDYALRVMASLPEPAFSMNYVPPEYIKAMFSHKQRKGADGANRKRTASVVHDVHRTATTASLPNADQRRILCAGDVWGLGCVIYALCSRRCDPETSHVMCTEIREPNFEAIVRDELQQGGKGKSKLSSSRLGYPAALVNLMLQMLKPAPLDRPTMAEVLHALEALGR